MFKYVFVASKPSMYCLSYKYKTPPLIFGIPVIGLAGFLVAAFKKTED